MGERGENWLAARVGVGLATRAWVFMSHRNHGNQFALWRKGFWVCGWAVKGLVDCGYTFIPPRHSKKEPERSFEEISFPKPGVAL